MRRFLADVFSTSRPRGACGSGLLKSGMGLLAVMAIFLVHRNQRIASIAFMASIGTSSLMGWKSVDHQSLALAAFDAELEHSGSHDATTCSLI